MTRSERLYRNYGVAEVYPYGYVKIITDCNMMEDLFYIGSVVDMVNGKEAELDLYDDYAGKVYGIVNYLE